MEGGGRERERDRGELAATEEEEGEIGGDFAVDVRARANGRPPVGHGMLLEEASGPLGPRLTSHERR